MDSYFNLIEGWNYYLEYENNINPGTATIKIIGMDRYINISATINFTIKK